MFKVTLRLSSLNVLITREDIAGNCSILEPQAPPDHTLLPSLTTAPHPHYPTTPAPLPPATSAYCLVLPRHHCVKPGRVGHTSTEFAQILRLASSCW